MQLYKNTYRFSINDLFTKSKSLFFHLCLLEIMLQQAVQELSQHFEFDSVEFVKSDSPGFSIVSNIIYYDNINSALRGLGNWISKAKLSERTLFTDRGVMLDCSRGAVPVLDCLYSVIRLLSLLGFNQLFLYTEDTYACDYHLFGYLRGPFTKQEIILLDNYCFMLGIELVPCIQVLGHLGNLLQFPQYSKVKETDEVLLVNHPDTYLLISKMIEFWSIVRSSRIHLGMDETYGLGSSKKFSDMAVHDIFALHLNKVIEICHKFNKRPLIWSDMLFCKDDLSSYYSSNPSFNSVDSNVDYVYWDYFHTDPALIKNRIHQHYKMSINKNLVVAPGAWTWNRFWSSLPFAFKTADACINACLESDCYKVLYTCWGDDINEYDLTSAFPAFIHLSDLMYSTTDKVDLKFDKLCGGCLSDFICASYIDNPIQSIHNSDFHMPSNQSKWLLWNDPIFNFMQPQTNQQEMTKYSEYAGQLLNGIHKQRAYPLNRRLLVPYLLCLIIPRKVVLKDALLKAYYSKDISKIEQSIHEHLKPLQDLVERLYKAHRYLWLVQYKPHGLEVLELRYGGLMLRLRSLNDRLLAYVAYLKNNETEDGFDWFNSDVFPIKTNEDYMPMELVDSSKMSISAINLNSTDKIDDYVTHIDLMLPLKRMEDLEIELVKIWDDNSILQSYKRSCTIMRNLGTG
eukprot:NODE_810_length_4014_cov_0.270243.p1 type:complete len:683 gc:universal NODE_810_length_4014_cov_0.270243:2516-468(-)